VLHKIILVINSIYSGQELFSNRPLLLLQVLFWQKIFRIVWKYWMLWILSERRHFWSKSFEQMSITSLCPSSSDEGRHEFKLIKHFWTLIFQLTQRTNKLACLGLAKRFQPSPLFAAIACSVGSCLLAKKLAKDKRSSLFRWVSGK
jgi:hypothetical protein